VCLRFLGSLIRTSALRRRPELRHLRLGKGERECGGEEREREKRERERERERERKREREREREREMEREMERERKKEFVCA
jgi:hypothetical protein